MTERRGRPYVEAFPALSLRLTGKAYSRGARVIQWINEQGAPVGNVEVVELTETMLSIRYRFFGVPNMAAATGKLKIAISKRRLNPDRVVAEVNCPSCHNEVDLIYFARSKWACRVCHGLVHLINRCSPTYKKLIQEDALLRPILMFNDVLAEQSWLASIEQALPQLPQQLRFRVIGRWLNTNERPSGAPDVAGGWRDGDPGGFAVFERPKPVAPPAPLELNRLVRSLPLLGSRLFAKDLDALLAERFSQLGLAAALGVIDAGLQDREVIAEAVAAAVAIEPIGLASLALVLEHHLGDKDRVLVTASLPYTGTTELWCRKVGGSDVTSLLLGAVDDNQLTLSAWTTPDQVPRAEAFIHLALRLINEQLSRQAQRLRTFEINLDENATGFANQILSEHAKGRRTRSIYVDVDATQLQANRGGA